MALFGRRSARQRLQDASRQSLTIPTFNAPVDSIPWFFADLWPPELATVTPETALLADYLKADLHRIAHSVDEKLRKLNQVPINPENPQAEQARIIDNAREFASRRIQSTVRQLPRFTSSFAPDSVCDTTIFAAVKPIETMPVDQPPVDAAQFDFSATETNTAQSNRLMDNVAETNERRLRRQLAFVVRQEPAVRWAIGTHPDGSVVVATDIAHGWIPPGIELPSGIGLLEPGQRTGTARDMLDTPVESATYSPGDRLGWMSDVGETQTSPQPRELPAVEDLGEQISRDADSHLDLPRIAAVLANAAVAGDRVNDAEVDILRVHLDTMRYQLLAQYPRPDQALVRACMLVSAVEAIASGDPVAANYHYRWFQTLNDPSSEGDKSQNSFDGMN